MQSFADRTMQDYLESRYSNAKRIKGVWHYQLISGGGWTKVPDIVLKWAP